MHWYSHSICNDINSYIFKQLLIIVIYMALYAPIQVLIMLVRR